MALFENIYDASSSETVADWVELYIFSNQASLSKSSIYSRLSMEGIEEEKIESGFLDDIWSELERREILYGDIPPFEIIEGSIESRIEIAPNLIYLMCLLFSVFGNSTDSSPSGKLFERVSGEVVKNYLGGEVIVYGHPSKQEVEGLCTTLNEKFNFKPHSDFNDRGLDLLAWKKFGDERCGQVAILFQCAAGSNWKSKLNDIPLDAWTKYITWGMNPLKGFIFPKLITSSKFSEYCYVAGIVIDRARIYRNININSYPELEEDLVIWCDNKIKECDESEIH